MTIFKRPPDSRSNISNNPHPMSLADNLTIALIISVSIMAYTFWKTINSTLTRDRKIAIYFVTFVMPIVGFILYLIFKRHNNDGTGNVTA